MITILIYTVICLTDTLDGWVARRFKMVTDTGKVLDPLADKILVLVLLPLLEMQAISSFPVFIILAREFAIMTLRILSARNGMAVAAKFSGKLKTAITLPVCGILLARVQAPSSAYIPKILEPLHHLIVWINQWPKISFTFLIWLMVLVTIWSFWDYFENYIWQKQLKEADGNERKARRRYITWIPNTFSLLNLGCGLGAILLSLTHFYIPAVGLILIGIFLDALDGRLARKLNAHSKLGEALDAKADTISFGIAPAVMLFKMTEMTLPTLWGTGIGLGIAIMYFTAVRYRLNRFETSGHSQYFEGLPSPIGAAFVLMASVTPLAHPYILPLIAALISYLMISKIPYAHLEIANRNLVLKLCRIPTLIFMGIAIFNLLSGTLYPPFYTYEVLLGLIATYALSPWLPSKESPSETPSD